MKKNIKKLLLAGVAVTMIFAFAGCGSTSEDKSTTAASETETQAEQTESTAAETSGDYDIMEGFRVEENDDADYAVIYGNGFVLTMPEDDDWGYEADSTSLNIYMKDAREAGFGGDLVTIMAFDPEDTSYEDFPSYSVAGKSQRVNKTFIALFPTDAQFDPNDPDQEEDYTELFNYVKKISEGAADSPFEIDD